MQLLSIIRSLVWKLLTQLFIKNLLLLLEEKVLILLKSKTESDFFEIQLLLLLESDWFM